MTEAIETMHNRIVVGVDLAETGDHALREAVRLAQFMPFSELHVSHVIKADPAMHDATRLKQMADELEDRIGELRAHLARVCASPWDGQRFSHMATLHVRIGDPAEALVQVAVDVEADMIVVGTNGRTGIERLILGSVAEKLIRIAPLPVVVAHPRALQALPKSERPEPRKPGDDFRSTSLTDRIHLEFVSRNSHISGLI
jgi:nucleotide-binding universal stress UspA family protein